MITRKIFVFVDVNADIDVVTVAELGGFRHLTRHRLSSQATSAGCEDGTNPENFLRSAKNNIDRGQVLAPVNPCICDIRATDLTFSIQGANEERQDFLEDGK